MTAREVENVFNTRFAFELLDLLFSSSSSSSDKDECLLNKTPRKIRKIENYVDLVHECIDKKVTRARAHTHTHTHTHTRARARAREREKEKEGGGRETHTNFESFYHLATLLLAFHFVCKKSYHKFYTESSCVVLVSLEYLFFVFAKVPLNLSIVLDSQICSSKHPFWVILFLPFMK